LHTSSLNLQ